MQYLIMGEFLGLAFAGALYHFFEKRFLHLTTECSLRDYLVKEPASTQKALLAIVTACFAFTMAHSGGWMLSFSEVAGVLAIGYGFDNALNKASA